MAAAPAAAATEKNFRSKNSDEKNSDEKNLDEKIWPKKNGGQGTGARHGRCGGKARVINGDSWGAKPPRPPPGGKARVTEIPEGGKAPPDPPTTPFQKICPPGKFFEMIKTAPPPPDRIAEGGNDGGVPCC